MAAFYAELDTPLARIALSSDGRGLTAVHFLDGPRATTPSPARPLCDDDVVAAARAQLQEYFAGVRRRFDLPLAPTGTEFQRRVWEALGDIPFGTTTSYGALARRLGCPGGSRAVGAANGCNPLAIVVPCHRVLGASGHLTGYGGGVARKAALLDFERAVAATGPRPFSDVVHGPPSS